MLVEIPKIGATICIPGNATWCPGVAVLVLGWKIQHCLERSKSSLRGNLMMELGVESCPPGGELTYHTDKCETYMFEPFTCDFKHSDFDWEVCSNLVEQIPTHWHFRGNK